MACNDNEFKPALQIPHLQNTIANQKQNMKHYTLILSFLLLSTFSFGQNINSKVERDIVHSSILNHDRDISVYLPPSYYSSNLNYPVLYILDGDYNFNYVSGILELQASISENIPEMILVGISGKGSETYKKNCKPNIEGIEDKGNADQVSSFIQEELIPYVNGTYRTLNYKILAGHSIGGLFIINTALNKPSLFNNYIAISPALWWEGNAINNVASRTLESNPNYSTNVYVSLANEKGMGVGSLLKVATKSYLKNELVILFIAFIALLLAIVLFIKKGKKLIPLIITVSGLGLSAHLYFLYIPSNDNFKFKQFPNETHNSVGSPTYSWALRDIFKTWKGEQEFFNSSAELKSYNTKVVQEYNEAFNLQKILMGNTIFVLQGQPNELKSIQQVLIKTYPNSVANFNLQWAERNIKNGNTEAGQTRLQKTISNYPTFFNAYNTLAKIKMEEGKIISADSLISRGIQLAKAQKAQQWELNELIETREKINSPQPSIP